MYSFNGLWIVLRTHDFWLPLRPQAKQSVEVGGRSVYTKKSKRAYTNLLHKEIVKTYDGPTETGYVRLSVVFCFKWRPRDKKYQSLGWLPMSQRPDIDNLLKPLKDALESICFADDSQIVDVRARKIRQEIEGIYVKIEAVKPNRDRSRKVPAFLKNT